MVAQPTNQHVVELLDRVLREIAELKAEQGRLTSELRSVVRSLEK